MEILLALAIVAVGASGLYVAVTFNARTRRNIEPLIQGAISELSGRINAADKNARNLLGTLRKELAQEGETGRQEQMYSQLLKLGTDVERLDRSLAQQSASMAKVEEHITSEAQAVTSIGIIQESLSKRNDHDGRWTKEQMLDTMALVEEVWRDQGEVKNYLRSIFDYDAIRTAFDNTCRVIAAGVYLDAPGADMLWPLLQSFTEHLALKVLFSEGQHATRRRSYLLWTSPDGQQLEETLGAKLAACPGDSALADPGLEDLRNLLLALHIGGPGTIQIGPMIISRTWQALLGGIMTAREFVRDGGSYAQMSADNCEANLRQLGQDRVVELTAWADALTVE